MAKTKNNDRDKDFPSCRDIQFPFTVKVRFPGDLEYIPPVRKFIAELLQVSNFSSKFAYRSEIIVDEICNNAVVYGCRTQDAEIELSSIIFEDRIEFTIRDEGGTKENVRQLRAAVDSPENAENEAVPKGLGLEIVRMLSARLDVLIDEDNVTSVHIVRKREDEREKTGNSI